MKKIWMQLAVATILVFCILQVEGQCEDKSPLCAARLAEGKCKNDKTVQENCKSTCGLCSTNTTSNTTSRITPSITPSTLPTSSPTTATTTEKNTAISTTPTTPPTGAPTTPPTGTPPTQPTGTPPTQPTGTPTTPPTGTPPTQPTGTPTTPPTGTPTTPPTSTPTTTPTSTPTTTPTSTPTPTEMQKAVKVAVLTNGDYNMNFTVIFNGPVDESEYEQIAETLKTVLNDFNVQITKKVMLPPVYGEAGSNRIGSHPLTAISWKLQVTGKNGQTIDEMVADLSNTPELGDTIQITLPTELKAKLYGGNDFMVTTTAEAPPATTKKAKEKGFRIDDWDVVGITIGVGLFVIILIIITAVCHKRRQAKKLQVNGTEGSYDFELSLSPASNDGPATKTHL